MNEKLINLTEKHMFGAKYGGCGEDVFRYEEEVANDVLCLREILSSDQGK